MCCNVSWHFKPNRNDVWICCCHKMHVCIVCAQKTLFHHRMTSWRHYMHILSLCVSACLFTGLTLCFFGNYFTKSHQNRTIFHSFFSVLLACALHWTAHSVTFIHFFVIVCGSDICKTIDRHCVIQVAVHFSLASVFVSPAREFFSPDFNKISDIFTNFTWKIIA